LIVTNTCGADTIVSQTIGVGCTGIDPVVNAEPTLYYNASQQELNITLPVSTSTYQVVVFDQLGNEVKTSSTTKTNYQWGMSELASGVYFVQITNDKGKTVSRFIK
jgi:hypothetical protein